MKNKKILSLFTVAILSVSLFVGCNNTKKQIGPENQEVQQDFEELLTDYSKEGMTIFKNNYTKTDDLKFALRNIGINVSNLKLKTYNGTEIKINDYKDRNIVLEIIQAECDSCQLSAPIVHNSLKDSDIELIPVFLNSTKESIDNFYNKINLEIPQNTVIDENMVTKDKFVLTMTPTYIFIDSSGTVSLIKQSFKDEISFKDDLKTAFYEKKIYEYKNISE